MFKNIFKIKSKTEEIKRLEQEITKLKWDNKCLQEELDLDTELLFKFKQGYTKEDFVKEHGARSVYSCFSWNVTKRLMGIFFPSVVFTPKKSYYDKGVQYVEETCVIDGCKEIASLDTRLRDIPEILKRVESCKTNSTCKTVGKV